MIFAKKFTNLFHIEPSDSSYWTEGIEPPACSERRVMKCRLSDGALKMQEVFGEIDKFTLANLLRNEIIQKSAFNLLSAFPYETQLSELARMVIVTSEKDSNNFLIQFDFGRVVSDESWGFQKVLTQNVIQNFVLNPDMNIDKKW